MPKEQLESERISWFMNQLWKFYVEVTNFKFQKNIALSKIIEEIPITSVRAKENMPLFTNIGGIEINIYDIIIDDKNTGEIKLTNEGICYCIDKEYQKDFEDAIRKNILLYV